MQTVVIFWPTITKIGQQYKKTGWQLSNLETSALLSCCYLLSLQLETEPRVYPCQASCTTVLCSPNSETSMLLEYYQERERPRRHTCNSSTGRQGGREGGQGSRITHLRPGLPCQCKANLGYIARPYLKKERRQKRKRREVKEKQDKQMGEKSSAFICDKRLECVI